MLLGLLVSISSSFMLLTESPHRLAFILIISTFFSAINVAVSGASAWPGFIFFLVFVGGILVLYAYVVSFVGFLVPESLLKKSLIMTSILTILFFMKGSLMKVSFFTEGSEGAEGLASTVGSTSSSWNFLFLFVYLLVALLFLTLVLKLPFGPLRPLN